MMSQNVMPYVPSSMTSHRCTTASVSIVYLVPLARRLEADSSDTLTWLCDSVRKVPPRFSDVLETSVAAQDAPVLRNDISVLLAKDAIEPFPPAEMKSGFYSPRGPSQGFHRAQERQWPSVNPGSVCLESGPSQAPIQDVDVEAHHQMHPAPGLVCSGRPVGHLLSCLDSSLAQAIAMVCK